jgi:hypothetical protein
MGYLYVLFRMVLWRLLACFAVGVGVFGAGQEASSRGGVWCYCSDVLRYGDANP